RADRRGQTGGRFLTITGQHLDGTPTTVEDRQQAVEAVYARLFGARPEQPESRPESGQDAPPQPQPLFSLAARKVGKDLSDDELLAKARGAKNGDVFRRLYDHGDTSLFRHDDGRPDPSAADQSLCNRLAWWAGDDPPRIDRLF